MQQAYRVLRIVAESQTIRIVLMLRPNELMLKELYTACTDLKSEKSRGIKAVVLDFMSVTETHEPHNATVSPAIIDQACLAVRAVEAPVLAVVRGTASAEARLEALKKVNEFYLSHVMQTADAGEGLHAFLEKRKPRWKNK